VKQHIVRIAIGLVLMLVFVGHAARYYNIGIISVLDNVIYDARLVFTMPRGVDNRIVILDIDEKSLQEVARWPWPRDIMAKVVDTLFDHYKIAILGFDVVFAETDESSGIQSLDKLANGELKNDSAFQRAYRDLRPGLDNDALFAKSLKGRPVVLGYYLNSGADAKRIAAIPDPVLPKGAFAGHNIGFTTWTGYGGNLPQFLANSAGAGHFNSLPDDDGIVRRVPMIVDVNGQYYESLSLAMARVLLNYPRIEPGYPEDSLMYKGYSGLEWIKAGPLTVPVDDTVSALVPYRGDKGSFPYISLADVLAKRVPVDRLKGRIALVGTTAPGLLDLRATPVDHVYPGVEIHANLLAAMLDGKFKKKPPYMLGAEVVQLVIAGVLLSVLVPMVSALWATAATLGGLALVAGLNVVLWARADTALPLASALAMIVLIYVMNMAYGYFVESRAKRQFTELFGQYVPPELVDKMAEDPEKYDMQGREEVLTVLFSDVRGFTSISEGLNARDLSLYINDYLTAMSLVIRERRGTLDKYIGDAIMAFWGAPVEDVEHARNAVHTALEMQRRAKELSETFKAKGWPPCRIGVGVNAGVMRVGDMGSRLRKAYTVMGDAVNLGSRLEGLTKRYGVDILVGETARKMIRDIVFREVDRVRVKGKDEAVAIYEPVGPESEVGKALHDELRLWTQFLRQYRSRDWDSAELTLVNLQRMAPERDLYRVYSGRVVEMRRNPPAPGWDGVTVFETK